MKLTHHLSRGSMAIIAFAAITLVQADEILRVGDKAPALKVARWVKGTPVAGFDKDKIYVLEFWATWCGPCIRAMPHLSELARRYAGKVTFIGVDIWEKPKPGEDIDKTVDAFVKSMGDKMDFNVCRDQDTFMTDAWMAAAGRRGIPSTFVVKNGVVTWMGHPDQLGDDLAKIVDGTFDMAAFAAASKDQQDKDFAAVRNAKAQGADIQAQSEAYKAGDWKKVLSEADRLIPKYPNDAFFQSIQSMLKTRAIVHTDEPRAREMLRAEGNSPKAVSIAAMMANQSGLKQESYEVALKVLNEALAGPDANQNYATFAAAASAYSFCGDNAKAAETMEKAIALAKSKNAPEATLKGYEEKLKEYQSAPKG